MNTKVAEPEDKIAAANARERHQWRYARWGWNLIQLACCLYFIFSAICGGDAELMKQQQAARGMKIMYPELMYEKGQELKAGIY
ncbi:TPA: hypothetical protein ACTW90_003009 [Raoultella ornithinolytica]